MKKTTRRTLIEYGIFILIALVLYLTGKHTEVVGFLQRRLLATGIMNASVDNPAKGVESTSPMADLAMTLIDSKGKQVNLETFRGKVIFLNIWATWCPPCIAEMPSIHELYKKLGNDVQFVMISVDNDFETAKRFRERKEYSFEIYSLVSGMPTMYQTKSIPSTFVIDTEGRLVYQHQGMADYNTDPFIQFLRELK